MLKKKTLKVVAAVAGSFLGFVVTIILLSRARIITVPMAMLMLVALFGLYLGFGILIAIYRFIGKLD